MRQSSEMQQRETYTTRIRLNIDAPLGGVKVERQQSTLAAKGLEFVNILVTTIVSGVGETLRVLVGQNRAIGLHGGLTSQILSNGKSVS
jgi:hypothetical protein